MMQVKANLTGVAAAAIDGLHLDQGWPNFFNHGPFSEIWTKVRATPHNSIFLFFFCIFIEFLCCFFLINYFSMLFFSEGMFLDFFFWFSLFSVLRLRSDIDQFLKLFGLLLILDPCRTPAVRKVMKKVAHLGGKECVSTWCGPPWITYAERSTNRIWTGKNSEQPYPEWNFPWIPAFSM